MPKTETTPTLVDLYIPRVPQMETVPEMIDGEKVYFFTVTINGKVEKLRCNKPLQVTPDVHEVATTYINSLQKLKP
jgi:hypothetical protein